MPVRRKRHAYVVRWLLLLSIVSVGYVAMGRLLYVVSGRKARDEKQRVLLYKTDHRAVLAACEDVMRHSKDFQTTILAGNDKRLPAPILRLGARWVDIETDHVYIEMGGGFFHYGFEATKHGPPEDGVKEVIPGLWYFAESREAISEH